MLNKTEIAINKKRVERTKTDPLFRVQKLVRNRIRKLS